MTAWELRQGDAFAELASMPDGAVSAIVTDVPYGTGHWSRPTTGAGADPTCEKQQMEWDVWNPGWIKDGLRVSRGPVAFFFPIERVAEVVAEAGTTKWKILPWIKPDPKPAFPGQFQRGYEPVFVLRPRALEGGADYMIHSAPRRNRDAGTIFHPHQKPVPVVEWLIRQRELPDDVVLDPFAGSATTAVAALRQGRRFIGFDQSEEYVSAARARILTDAPAATMGRLSDYGSVGA